MTHVSGDRELDQVYACLNPELQLDCVIKSSLCKQRHKLIGGTSR